jgi:hypothetical protein
MAPAARALYFTATAARDIEWTRRAWSILPISPNSFAYLGSERAHSFLTLLALATLRASYTWRTRFGECDTRWEVEAALVELRLSTSVFSEFHGFSAALSQAQLHEQLRQESKRLVPRIIASMRERYPTDFALAEWFSFPLGEDSDDFDFESIEAWCCEGCPLHC